jgi:hypothetical protein
MHLSTSKMKADVGRQNADFMAEGMIFFADKELA